MNIGIVTAWFERGAAYVSRSYLEALSKEHNVYIYARGGEKYATDDPRWDLPNVTWEKKIPNMPMVTFINWKDFKKWLVTNSIEIIFFNEQRSWDIVRKLRNSKYLLGSYVDYYTKKSVPFFKFYDFLICNTKRHYEVFQDFGQTFFIPWGTDLELCKPKERVGESECVTFFHSAGMGGVNLRKGTDILVKAFQSVSGKARLIIHSQAVIEKFSSVMDIISTDNRIEFIQGTVPLPGLYYRGDVYVYPSRLEGIGLSIVEALACGLPVITTDNPPMNEFVKHNQTGYLVGVEKFQNRDDDYYWPESICSEMMLVEAMQFYVDNPHKIIEQSLYARQYALKHFNWNKNSAELVHLFYSIKRKRAWTRQEYCSLSRSENSEILMNLFRGIDISLGKGEKKNARKLLVMALEINPKIIIKRKTLSLMHEVYFKSHS
jgi:1,2-diacylglycerol 3-alpha-glucosyltransferase